MAQKRPFLLLFSVWTFFVFLIEGDFVFVRLSIAAASTFHGNAKTVVFAIETASIRVGDFMKWTLLSATALLSLSINAPAFAANFIEGSNAPSFNYPSSPHIGSLSAGSNTVTGSLGGGCASIGGFGFYDCNAAPDALNNTQDDFLFKVPVGYLLTGVTFGFNQTTAPAGFRAGFQLDDALGSIVMFEPSAYSGMSFSRPLNLGAGDYGAHIFGGLATGPEDFALDYSYKLDLTKVSGAVPEPATWALMIMGFGFVGGAMRRRKAQTLALA